MKRSAPQTGTANSTGDTALGEFALPLAALGNPPSEERNPQTITRWFRVFRSQRLLVAVALLSSLAVAGVLVYPHVRAWHHLSAARSALKKYHNLEAIRHLQICLKTWPADEEVLFLVART